MLSSATISRATGIIASISLVPMAALAEGQAAPATDRGMSNVVAWLLVSTVAATMIWFIWRNARKEPE